MFKLAAISFLLLLFSLICSATPLYKTPGLSKLKGDRAVIFLIDKSGSMKKNHNLDTIKEVLSNFIDVFNQADIVSVIAYDSRAFHVYEPKNLTIKEKNTLKQRIELLYPNGSGNVLPVLSNVLNQFNNITQVNSKLLILISDEPLVRILNVPAEFQNHKLIKNENQHIYIDELAVEQIKEFGKHDIQTAIVSMAQIELPEQIKQQDSFDLYDSVNTTTQLEYTLTEILSKMPVNEMEIQLDKPLSPAKRNDQALSQAARAKFPKLTTAKADGQVVFWALKSYYIGNETYLSCSNQQCATLINKVTSTNKVSSISYDTEIIVSGNDQSFLIWARSLKNPSIVYH